MATQLPWPARVGRLLKICGLTPADGDTREGEMSSKVEKENKQQEVSGDAGALIKDERVFREIHKQQTKKRWHRLNTV